MILTRSEILKNIEAGEIMISPFNEKFCTVNSYDVHLGRTLKRYVNEVVDPDGYNPVISWDIPDEGYILYPGQFVLGVTQEFTYTHNHVPFIEGCSSLARLGLSIHQTAGRGDIGFSGHWTLELSCKMPIILREGMRIGQLIYFEKKGDVDVSYQKVGRYNNAINSEPIEYIKK